MTFRWRLLSELATAIKCIVVISLITFNMPVYGSPPVTPVPALAEQDIPILAAQLKSKSRQDRVSALYKLRGHTFPANSQPLIAPVFELFQHDDEQYIRLEAAKILTALFRLKKDGLSSNSVYVAPVLDIFQHDPEQNIRIQATQLLAFDLPFTTESAKVFFTALNDNDASLRQLVANCIPADKKYI